jgi:predicted LPLAT superfamily acyltransferase
MSRWDGKTLGPLIGYQIFVLLIKTLGLGFTYFILRIVSYYYFLFETEKRNGMIEFYKRSLNYTHTQGRRLTRKNFYLLGQSLVDGVAFLVGRGNQFTHSFTGEEYLIKMKNGGKGGILLSAHVGNWDTAGNLLKKRVTSNINVVMLDAEVQGVKNFLESTTGGSRFNIIAIKDDLSHIIHINNALRNNEFVAIHADRFLEGAKYFEINFLGRKAKFPLGPFIIASKFNAPVSYVFAVKNGKYHYELSSTKPIDERLKPEEFAQQYVYELEKKVKATPEQWFNYFDFYH